MSFNTARPESGRAVRASVSVATGQFWTWRSLIRGQASAVGLPTHPVADSFQSLRNPTCQSKQEDSPMIRSLIALGALAVTTSTVFAQQPAPQAPARGLEMALAVEA